MTRLHYVSYYFRPIINNKFEEKTCGEGPSLATMFDDDKVALRVILFSDRSSTISLRRRLAGRVRVWLRCLTMISTYRASSWTYRRASVPPLTQPISTQTPSSPTGSSTRRMRSWILRQWGLPIMVSDYWNLEYSFFFVTFSACWRVWHLVFRLGPRISLLIKVSGLKQDFWLLYIQFWAPSLNSLGAHSKI